MSKPTAAATLARVRDVLAAFDWERDDRQLALEEIERIVTADAARRAGIRRPRRHAARFPRRGGVMTAGPQAGMVAFALHTADRKWIEKNDATVDGDGRAVIMLPVSAVKVVTMAFPPGPVEMICYREGFPKRNCPKDFPHQSAVLCPARWVPETAARLAWLTGEVA